MKILFLSNYRSIPYDLNNLYCNENLLSSGLVNSIKFIVDMLKHDHVDATYLQVKDGNCIDCEVTKLKPNIVIIEALWVTPEKIDELQKLHPNVKWIIRLHSETPFIANEGIAMDWIFKCSYTKNVTISCNSKRIQKELEALTKTKIEYLPNYYSVKNVEYRKPYTSNILNIGCFGAIRPMKNQLIQAIAAIRFADYRDKKLKFHINVNREETGGNSVLKNLRALFANTYHELVEHPWCKHEEFVNIVKSMDIGMQVSFSETYNIVTADMVNNNIPVVVSSEMKWLNNTCKANPTDCDDIIEKLEIAYKKINDQKFLFCNKEMLRKSNTESKEIWMLFATGKQIEKKTKSIFNIFKRKK